MLKTQCLGLDAIKMLSCSHKEVVTTDGGRGLTSMIEFIRGELLEFTARFKYRARSVKIEAIDATLGINRRGSEAAANTFAPDHFASVRLDTGGHAVISYQEQQVVNDERGGALGDTLLEIPGNVRFRHVAVTPWPNRN